MPAETVVVIDFETTGLSPDWGARATEVAAVRMENGEVTATFQSLMDAGVAIPQEIEALTGITNTMRRAAPPAAQIIRELHQFIAGAPLVAHNARFDAAFLDSEYKKAGIFCASPSFACTMKLARRIYPRAPNHKLQTLIRYADIPCQGRFHRALADATATAHQWQQKSPDLRARYRLLELPGYARLCRLSALPLARIDGYIKNWP